MKRIDAYPADLVAAVAREYGSGKTMRETATACGTTVKVLQRLMPRHGIERRPAVPRDQTGARNACWKGDSAGYDALHLRVVALRGRPQRCDLCGTTSALAYDWANLTGWYEDVQDYARMCRPCHRTYDARRRLASGTATIPAHLR